MRTCFACILSGLGGLRAWGVGQETLLFLVREKVVPHKVLECRSLKSGLQAKGAPNWEWRPWHTAGSGGPGTGIWGEPM